MKIYIYLIGCLLSITLLTPNVDAQTLKEITASKHEYRKKNLGIEKKKSLQRTRRGGMMTYPVGIADKKINMGFTLGGNLALMDALNKQNCPIGGGFSLFMHGILKNTNTLALGAEIKGFYLLANRDKYVKQFQAMNIESESLMEPSATVGNWILATAQFSVMGNFNPRPRFNIQIKANAGPLLAMVPKYDVMYQLKEIQSDGTYKITTYDFEYQTKNEGMMAIGTDMLFAITKHAEFKLGIDWSYLRFNYYEIGVKRIEYQEVEQAEISPYGVDKNNLPKTRVAQFGVFDIHAGFAFSF
jgi:hypothetical protein